MHAAVAGVTHSNCTLLGALSKRQYVCLFPPLINLHLLNQTISHYNPELH